VLALLFVFGILCVFKAPGDPDFGWHYKYGEYIVQHGKILRQNTFSYTFTDYKWANSYWVSQVVLYLTHYYLGSLVAGLLFAATLSASTVFYVKAVSKNSRSTILLPVLSAILLFIEFSDNGVTNRPMFFSTLFLMFLVVILFNDFRETSTKPPNPAKLLVLPVLFLIWANAHADFILGLLVLGLYVIDRMIMTRVPQPPQEWAVRSGTRSEEAVASRLLLCMVGLLSIAVTLINPYGFGLWQTLLKESYPYQFSHISEWIPVNTNNLYYFIVYCTALGLIVSALIGAHRRLPSWYILALGAFCIASVRSQYFLRIAVIVGIPAFIAFWGNPLLNLRNTLSANLVKKIKAGLVALLALSTLSISTVFLTDVEQKYPKDALDFALANNIKGNVFNYYGWGGYMIWKYPQVKTFVDGRMPSWREGNKSVFEDYIKVTNAPKKNSKILSDYGVSWILCPKDSEFTKFLRTSNSGWKEVYSDDVASVFGIMCL